MKVSHHLAAAASLVLALPALAESNPDDLAKQLQNPVASLISVPFQNNFDFHIGPDHDGWRYTLNLQPVIPVPLNKDWNVIIRTIVPFTHQEDVFKGSAPSFDEIVNDIPIDLNKQQLQKLHGLFNRKVASSAPGAIQTGLGDITQSFFFSPSQPGPGGLIWGFGPAILYPSATNSLLGAQKWALGPTLVALEQQGPWTYGVLSNQLWSVGGNEERRSISSLFLQPFLSYTTTTKTTYGLNMESTYDWMAGQYTAPVNATVSQVLKIGALPLSLALGGRYYVQGPHGAPDWGLRFVVTLLFPEGKHSTPSDGKSFVK